MTFSLRISFSQISGSLEIQMQLHWGIAFPPSQNVNIANGDWLHLWLGSEGTHCLAQNAKLI